jgi:hypothetical protein
VIPLSALRYIAQRKTTASTLQHVYVLTTFDVCPFSKARG